MTALLSGLVGEGVGDADEGEYDGDGGAHYGGSDGRDG
jgi:hypothetical protein